MNNKINKCWVIKVTFYKNGGLEVNFNEGYTSFDKAKAVILKKINPKYLYIESEYEFYDKENVIDYELKLVDIYE
jgi:translation elongation factor P/translation initiation factor 5A